MEAVKNLLERHAWVRELRPIFREALYEVVQIHMN